MKYRKFWAALVGAGATSGITIWGPDTTAGQLATIVAPIATAAAVFAIPNEPA